MSVRGIRLFALGARATPGQDHEEIFVARYQELRRWAERLCDGQVHDAEDLLQDAFVEFVRRRPPLEDVQDPTSYLRTMLRNLHVSDIRRGNSLKRGGRSCVDFDCLELAVAGVDPRSAWDRRVELELLCRYACDRKETSKSASVLILRFFHDYLPSEIALLMRTSRRAVDEWLRLARAEARRFLENPTGVTLALDPEGGADLAQLLRRNVFAHASGECLSPGEMEALYEPSRTEPLGHAVLAHLVSCPVCLAAASRAAGLTPPGDGQGTATLRPSERKDRVRSTLRRALARSQERRPTGLVIAANGFEVSSQVLQPGHNEHTVRPNIGAEIGFVELFGETGDRLLYLEIQPPPDGAVEQNAEAELSDGRHVSLRLRFDQPWPEIQASYDDPELEIAPAPPAFTPERPAVRWAWWRPAAFALASLMLLALAGLLVRRQLTDVPAVSAAALIRNAEAQERVLVSRRDRILHRVVEFEDRLAPAGAVLRRYRIETWRDADKQAEVRRVYNDRGDLVTADPSDAPWKFSLSPGEFRALIAPYLKDATAEQTVLDGEPVYIVRVNSSRGALQSAVLVLAKADLHPLQVVLLLRTGSGVHEYTYRERGFALLERSSAPDVFQPHSKIRPLPSRVPEVPPAPDPVELEAEAWYLMHRAGACAGEQTGIGWRPEGRLEIRAVVADEARRQELAAALAGLRDKAPLDLSVLVVGAVPGAPARAGDPSLVRARREALSHLPVYPLLRARFARETADESALEARILEYSDNVVGTSDRLLAQAWSLARLAEWIDSRPLEGRARMWAQEMLRAHGREFRQSAAELRALLEQLTPSPAAPASAPFEDGLLSNARALLQSVSARNAAVHAGFLSGGDAPDASWPASLVTLERQAMWMEQHGLGEALAADRRR